MSALDVQDLGAFTATELRVGGIGERGFLQPLMAAGSAEPGQEDREQGQAVSNLSRRGLMVASEFGWRPIGRFLAVLNAAGAARSFVACPPADERYRTRSGGRVVGSERMWLGKLGHTDRVLDLCPADDGYRSRLISRDLAAAELAAWSGLDGAPARADLVAATTEGAEDWALVVADGRMSGPALCIETATVISTDSGLLQQRLHIFRSDDGPWLLLGTQQRGQAGQAIAPAGPARVERALRQVLNGELVRL